MLQKLKTKCRLYKKTDSERIKLIQESLSDLPIPFELYVKILSNYHTQCTVCTVDGIVYGFVVYQIRPQKVTIIDIGVINTHHSVGIGSSLLIYVMSKCVSHEAIYVDIPERNVDAQLFFQKKGFRLYDIVKSPRSGFDDIYTMKLN